MESPSACHINSFVFFDIETSGLYSCDRITEICLLSVHRSAIEDDRVSVSSTPRVMDKLVLCVDPVQKVTSTAKMMSGLDRDILLKSHKKPFDKSVGKMIICFLERQQPPLCLLAHNGYKFDFPFLRRSLKHADISGGSFDALPEGIRCADTLYGFRSIKPSLRSHSLSNLYLNEFGGPIEDAHHAEGDTMALMQLFLQDGEEMMTWCDKQSSPF